MDTRDGRIYWSHTIGDVPPRDRQYLMPIVGQLTPLQRTRMRVGRNDPCPCNSGKKFKRCCLGKVVR